MKQKENIKCLSYLHKGVTIMNFIIYMLVCIIVSAIIVAVGIRFITPLLKIKNRIKYMLLIILLDFLLGASIIFTIDINHNPVIGGCLYGVVLGVLQVMIDYER